jgi:hypothetical protein
LIRFLKGWLGLCQCEGCMSRHTTKLTMLRDNGTFYHIYVCDDCAIDIRKLYKVK